MKVISLVIQCDKYFVEQLKKNGYEIDYKTLINIYKDSRNNPILVKKRKKKALPRNGGCYFWDDNQLEWISISKEEYNEKLKKQNSEIKEEKVDYDSYEYNNYELGRPVNCLTIWEITKDFGISNYKITKAIKLKELNAEMMKDEDGSVLLKWFIKRDELFDKFLEKNKK